MGRTGERRGSLLLVLSSETLWHLLGPEWMAAHVLAGLAAAAQLADGNGGPPVAAVEGRPSGASLYLAYTCLVVAIVGLVLARKMLGLKESDRLRKELVAARSGRRVGSGGRPGRSRAGRPGAPKAGSGTSSPF